MELNNFFSSTVFAGDDGILQCKELRMVRNFSSYYQELFSVCKQSAQPTDGVFFKSSWHNLFKAGHHGTWQTAAACQSFYQELAHEKNFNPRVVFLCEMMSQQGWGYIQCVEQDKNFFSYKVIDSLEAAVFKNSKAESPQCAFMSGMVLAVHFMAHLPQQEKISPAYLDEVLANYGQLVKEENCSAMQGNFCLFTVINSN